MARSMSKGRVVGRPALGANNTGNYKRPKAAYKVDNGTPAVVSQGKLSKPSPRRHQGLKTLTPDVAPKVVRL